MNKKKSQGQIWVVVNRKEVQSCLQYFESQSKVHRVRRIKPLLVCPGV